MWVLVLAILVGVVVLATGMRSSLDEAWIQQTDGDPSDLGDVVDEQRMSHPEATSSPRYRVDRAA